MTTVLTVGDSEGARRCDAKCHNAHEAECDCVCGGRYHGAGSQGAIEAARRDILSGLLGEEAAAVARAVLEDGVQQSLFADDERCSPVALLPFLEHPAADPGVPDPPIAPASDRAPHGIDTLTPTSDRPAPAGPSGSKTRGRRGVSMAGAAQTSPPAYAGISGETLGPITQGEGGSTPSPATKLSMALLPRAGDGTAGVQGPPIPGSPASAHLSRPCATPGCGRKARWGSTRCSACDPWRTMVSLRGLGARA